MIAEMVRRYSILGIECCLLEVQKLAWFLERSIQELGLDDALRLEFKPNRYGPYSDRLRHLLDGLDGSYLHCERRLGDARPPDLIWFNDARKDQVNQYLTAGDGKSYRPALERTAQLIDGFESPLGLELMATVDWMIARQHVAPSIEAIRDGLRRWPGGPQAASRKQRLFDERLIEPGAATIDAASWDGSGPDRRPLRFVDSRRSSGRAVLDLRSGFGPNHVGLFGASTARPSCSQIWSVRPGRDSMGYSADRGWARGRGVGCRWRAWRSVGAG